MSLIKNRNSENKLGIVQAALASIGFGFLGVFGKWAFAAQLSIQELLTYRFTLAAALLWIFVLLFRPRQIKISGQQFRICLLLGVFGYPIFANLYFYAIQGLSIPLAALLLFTFPFWVGLFSHWGGNPLKAREWIAFTLALVGLASMLWGNWQIHQIGALFAGVGSGLTYAIYVLASARWQKNIEPLTSSLYIISISALTFYISSSHFSSGQGIRPVADLTIEQFSIIAGIGILSTIFPMTLVLASLQKISARHTALISMGEPITASIASAIIFKEGLSLHQGIGAILILIGLFSLPKNQ